MCSILEKGVKHLIGEEAFQPYAINTFSHRGREFTAITPVHYVSPHSVRSYRRKDGTYVSGYWRDGDGNTNINRDTGYYARNPGGVTKIYKKGRWL